MSVNEDFWEDLLSHIRDRVLVPVVGADLTVVDVGNAAERLSWVIGQRLVERYGLGVSAGPTSMGEAVAAFLRERGRDEAERLYRVIYDLIVNLDPVPSDALRHLAAIDDLRLFVTTTPDRLLAQAINEVRFQGRPGTREITFSPNQSTSEQSRNAQPAAPTDTVVLNLFGQAAATLQYAIHEEDRLEWLYALVSGTASLPDWLGYQLRDHPILFVGCEISDWVGRFLLRWLSNVRLSLERKQFFFVGSSASHEPSLPDFFATYCRKSQVQHLEMEPAAFVAELRARWRERSTARPPAPVDTPGPASDTPTIFVSYMREDADAARRLYNAIAGLGGEVWPDERWMSPGDVWDPEILTAIRHGTVRLFIPIISANTERALEGDVFREWNAAADRADDFMGRRFIVPVIVDEDYEGDVSAYRNFPPYFGRFHFGCAPGGDPDAELVNMLTTEIRAMREEQHGEELRAAVGWAGRVAQPPDRLRPHRGIDAPVTEHIRIGDRDAGARLSGSVFAPPAVESGRVFLVQVFAHLAEHEAEAAALAREFDEAAERRGTVPFESPVLEDERLAFELRLPGLLVDDPVQSMVWIGRPQSVQFGVSVPPKFPPQTVIGTVTISRDSVPIGHLKFKVSVLVPGKTPGPVAEWAPTSGMHRYRRAFISYASADRNEVLKRTQMLALVETNFFQDLLNLDPGQRWERQLYREIDLCHVFYLFWSSAAKESTWVLKEVNYAITRQGGDELAPPEIVPVIIEGPPPVDPPPELAHLHFNDRMIYFMLPKRTD